MFEAVLEVKSLSHRGAVQTDKLEAANFLCPTFVTIQQRLIAETRDIPLLRLRAVMEYDEAQYNIPLPKKNSDASPWLFNPKECIFDGVYVACGDDLSTGDKEVIIALVLALGGNWDAEITDRTTHFVTALDNNEKAKEQSDLIRVLPHWIDTCAQLKRPLDEGIFRFPNPTVQTDCMYDGKIKKSAPPKQHLKFTHGMNLAEHLMALAPVFGLLDGFQFRIDDDAPNPQIIRRLIESSGGKVVNEFTPPKAPYNTVNIYICQYRDASFYSEYLGSGDAVVVSPLWLYYILHKKSCISPLQNIFHHPLPAQTLYKDNYSIAITNYVGESRQYLQFLIESLGAKYAPALNAETDSLVACQAAGPKYEAAMEWDLLAVNHIYLEHCYAEYNLFTPAKIRYLTYQQGGSLLPTVGQQALNLTVLRRLDAETSHSDTRLRSKRVNNESITEATTSFAPPQKRPRPAAAVSSLASQPSAAEKPATQSLPAMLQYRLLITGVSEFKRLRQVQALIRAAPNWEMTEDPLTATHVVARGIYRTAKLLASLAHAPTYLNVSFLAASADAGALADPADPRFTLHDEETERALGRRLPEILARARVFHTQGGLLQGYTFHLTGGIKGGFEVIDGLIRVHGGNPSVHLIKATSRIAEDCIPSRVVVGTSGEITEKVIMVTIPEQTAFLRAFSKHVPNGLCFSGEWLLTCILKMELDLDESHTLKAL
ncbi:hypothetical protein D0Z00_003806 [Geotrichum galactomycetum]|uniref:Uncharacterized protein n=1 Tax=Geotrichum galactomycetum TaxID=27317 RepID=A0ACB6V0C7_9ASCO|nr:hypothetical protein D0Z00_003806 [Geotrichum candidum]